MTSAVNPSPEDESGSKALSPADGSGRNAFLPDPEIHAGPQASAEPRAATSRFLDYGAHAAMIVGLVGFAWTVSNHVVNRPSTPSLAKAAVQASATETAAPAKVDELADLRQANKQMADDLRHLRTNLDALRSAVHDDKSATQLRVLQAGLENVQSGLTSARNEAAQLNSKLDKVEQPKLAQLTDRVGKLEKNAMDMASTASIAPAPAKVVVAPPPQKPQPAKVASAEDPHKALDDAAAKPQVLPGYVVRDVYEGVAYIESKHGPMEVVPGVSIPGAGVVKSIDRQGKGWTVTTTKGVLAFAAAPRPMRRADYRGRGFYPGYPGDF